jgi:AraC-like DNA-binding protein
MSTDYLRVEEAINYLEENFRAQPSLQELAEHLKMSPFHFQRLFRLPTPRNYLIKTEAFLMPPTNQGFPVPVAFTTSLQQSMLSPRANSRQKVSASRLPTEYIQVLLANVCSRQPREVSAL